MAYTKQTWQNEVLNGAEKYHISAPGTNIEDALISLSTPIVQAGTPVTAERMNHIEEGIANNREFSMRCLTENYYQTDEKNIDEITDSFCLISGAVTNSGPLFALLRDQSGHAYLENKFFEAKSTAGRREQIATGYYEGAKASRVYRWDDTWSDWMIFHRSSLPGLINHLGTIELNTGAVPDKNHGGVIDFHFGGDQADYTSRIIELNRNQLVVGGIDPASFVFAVDGYIGAKNINDSGWIEMGLANGWTRIAGPGFAKFRKYNNVVYAAGAISGGAATSQAFSQLPSGFRPHVRMTYACTRDDNTAITGVVGADGIMWFTTTAYGNMIHFSGSWLAEL